MLGVEGSAKVDIDAVTITNTGGDGVVLTGRGNDVWNSGSAITRCEVSGAGGNGITAGSITQAILLDNFVRGSRRAGIQVSAAHSRPPGVPREKRDEEADGVVVAGQTRPPTHPRALPPSLRVSPDPSCLADEMFRNWTSAAGALPSRHFRRVSIASENAENGWAPVSLCGFTS